MTGVEAVSNGVPAFRPPESRNAAATLVAMAALSITMFLGITLLAHAYGIVPNERETVVSQIARATFGGRGVLYYAVQAATMLILVLAANTAYADFPRLASIVARDRFLPRQFMNQGDRLAFSNGIVILSALAGGAARGVRRRHARADPALHDRRLRLVHAVAGRHGDPLAEAARRRAGAPVPASTASAPLVTGIVLVIVAMTKATEGAWIIIVMIPALVSLFTITRRHYDQVASELTLAGLGSPSRRAVTWCWCRSAASSGPSSRRCSTPRTCSRDVRAVYVEVDPAGDRRPARPVGRRGARAWQLVVLESPYRSLMEPLLEYIEQLQRDDPPRTSP